MPTTLPITLPDSGVDISQFLTLAIPAVGVFAAVAVGGWVAFLLLRRGCEWFADYVG